MADKKVLFIDRDGTILVEPQPSEQVDSFEKFAFVPGAISGLKALSGLGYELVLATNQDGLGTPSFPYEDYIGPQNLMLETLKGEGIVFSDILVDRSFPSDNLPTRKPGVGMFSKYLAGGYDLAASYVIGDRDTDVLLAANLGCKAIRLVAAPAGGFAADAAATPSASAVIPGAVGVIPSAVEGSPAASDVIPSAVEGSPAASGVIPSAVEESPAGTGVQSADIQKDTQNNPLQNDRGYNRQSSDCQVDAFQPRAVAEAPQPVLCARSWAEIAEFIRLGSRSATVKRTTGETDICVSVDLDGRIPTRISTGLNFFDHMLDQIARHSGIGLQIEAKGDLEVDEHHTMEDVAIALGEALRQALGSKRGIERYGFALPMDECEAMVLLDLGGRIDFAWDVTFTREYVGDTPTEMFRHFYKSLCEALQCNLHISARGENNHHLAEAVFKAFARALRQAIYHQPFNYDLASTKGVL